MNVIFWDGFESGSFSAWTTYGSGSGCSITVGSSYAHSGKYGARATVTGANEAYVQETVNSLAAVYLRAYFRFGTLPVSGYLQPISIFSSGLNEILDLIIPASATQVRLYSVNGSGYSSNYYNFTWSANTWYCIEVYVGISSTVGVVTLWINGVQIGTVTGQNTAYYGNIYYLRLGEAWDTITTANNTDFDDVVVADSYVGPDQTFAFSDSGLGADLVSQISLALSEVGVGVDSGQLQASVLLSESGLGSEGFSGQAAISVSDAAVGVDALLHILLALADSGVATDSVGLQALISVLESASGSELASLALAVADSGVALDAVQLHALVSAFEQGLGVDASTVQALLSVLDSGVGADVVRAGQLFIRSVTLRGNGVAVVLKSQGGMVTLRGDGAPVKAQ